MSKIIIIPKGLVNPEDTTIIEIPAELSEERELIASPSQCRGSANKPNFGKTQTRCCPSIAQSQAKATPTTVTNLTKTTIKTPNSLFESSCSTTEIPNFGKTRSVHQTTCPSFQTPQATSTPKPRGNITKTIHRTSSSIYDSSLFDSGSSIQPSSFGTTESSCTDSAKSPGRTINFGKTQTICPGASRGVQRPANNITRQVYRTSNSIYDSSYPENVTGSSCADSYRSPERTLNFGTTQTICPGSPQATSTPKSANVTHTILRSSGSVIDSSYYDSGSSIEPSSFGTINSTCPSSRASLAKTYDFGRTQSICPGNPQASSTPRSANNVTYTILRSSSSIMDSSYYDSGSSIKPSSFGTIDSTCPSSRASLAKPYDFGRTQTICPGNPQATSTPRPASNVTHTILRSSSSMMDSSYNDSGSSIQPSSFGTIDSTCPSSRASPVRSYNFGKTRSICPGASPGFQTPQATSTPTPRTICPSAFPSFQTPQATSTPKPPVNVTRIIPRTPTSLYDSSFIHTSSPITPSSFGSIESSCTDNSRLSDISPRRIIRKTSKTYIQSPQPTCGSKLQPSFMSSSSSLYSQNSTGPLSSEYLDSTGYSDVGRNPTRSGSRGNSVKSCSPKLGTLGNAYLNSTPFIEHFEPSYPSSIKTCSDFSKSQQSKNITPSKLIKKVSRTITESPPACDGSKTRTIHEVSSVEQEQQNQSIVDDIRMELEEIENSERSQLEEDLKLYHQARRALMANTTITFGERSTNLSTPPKKKRCIMCSISRSKHPCSKKRIEFQKVVIPRGMINPHETTVIEIPTNLQKQPVVIAKRKTETSRSSSRPRSGSRSRYGSFRPKHTSSPTNVYDQSSSRSYAYSPQIDGIKNPADLEATERQEREQLQRDLDEFQRARRKLLANTSHLVNGEEKSSVRSFRQKYY